ncbi:hypothetical protein [Xanthomonas phage X1]|nr:hypothetical protein [Xanthomonas phage X1]
MSIRSWWKKNVTEPRRRRKFFNLRARHGSSTRYHFLMVKEALEDLLYRLDSTGTVSHPEAGICFNAGFQIGGDWRDAGETFLSLAEMFNSEVRGLKKKFTFFTDNFPFEDVDALDGFSLNKWVGESLKVRRACIEWILDNIEKHQLHRG